MSNILISENVLFRKQVHGKGRIAGVSPGLVTVDGEPSARDVWLYARRPNSGQLIARTLSAPDGTYQFTHLPLDREYMVVANDRFRVHNAAVVDMISPVLMPEFSGE